MSVSLLCPQCRKNLSPTAETNGVVSCAHCGTPCRIPTAILSLPTPSSVPAPLSASGVWAPGTDEGGEQERPITLEGLGVAWIDRVLPAQPARFLVVVGLVVGLFWLLGYLLAADRTQFLTVPDWHIQPFFLAVHFITLRMFVTVYVRNYCAGVRHMDVPETEVKRIGRWVLGVAGPLLALVVALPLCWMDWHTLHGPKYYASRTGPLLSAEVPIESETDEQEDAPTRAVGPADVLMWGSWSLEWILNAYVWVLLVAFMLMTLWTLWRWKFRQPVEVVLHEKHYRPFLMMSAQGATIVFVFSVANVFYVWYAEGAWSDYIGLIVTLVLLLVSFAPPWLYLRSRIDQAVRAEVYRLREAVLQAGKQAAASGASDLSFRLDQILAMLRIEHLERMQAELGQNEARGVILRLLAPVGTLGFRFLRPILGPLIGIPI